MSDDGDAGSGKIDRSSIAFPYVDLDGAIDVARAIHDAGGVGLDRDQLAAAMNLVPGSGNFSIKVGAARMFGLVTNAGGKNELTPLGFEILEPSRAQAAKAKAFLEVPLYKKLYDNFRGRQLPPRPLGLENTFVSYGVAPKQKDKARQVFERSARSAKFFPTSGEDRLVVPVLLNGAGSDDGAQGNAALPAYTAPPPPPPATPPAPAYHPFIEGLLKTLPAEGETWSLERRAKWLEAASNIFDLIYGNGGGTVEVGINPERAPKPE